MHNNPDIYNWILSEESAFETDQIQVGENWYWNFRDHVQLIFHLKNGIFYTGENDWLRAFKQVMRPLLRLSYWTEDLEVKDVVFFIEEGRHLSFLLKKYHDEVYTREHDLDEMFDEITESDIDYGGVLLQKGVKRPEVIKLQSIAFCDQTDIMGGPIGIKLHFTPDKLRSMSEYGWGEESNGANISLEELCTLATFQKDSVGTLNENKNKVPGKTLEVYIVRGTMPEHYLKDNNDMEYHCNQLQIVAFYKKKDGKKQGVTLYRKKEDEGSLKFHASEPVYQRALGYSDGEAFIHPQVWTNFLTIHKMSLIEAAAKVPLVTDDPSYTQKNRIQDMENLEVTTIQEGKTITQVPTAAPTNIQLFQNAVNEWYDNAQSVGAAYDPLLGKEPASGTTFRGQERVVAQGQGWHNHRRGRRAKLIEHIYRDWIIDDMVREILNGTKFLATLSTDELTWVAEQAATSAANKKIKDIVFDNKMMTKEEQDTFTQMYKQNILKKGNKWLIDILKDEFRDIKIRTGLNIAGKQKNLADLSDKVLSIFKFAFQNPAQFQQAMQVPALAKSFENILEYSGMNISDFSTFLEAPVMSPLQPQEAQEAGQPLELAQTTPNE